MPVDVCLTQSGLITVSGFAAPFFMEGLDFDATFRTVETFTGPYPQTICNHDCKTIYTHLYTDMDTCGRIYGDTDVETSSGRDTHTPIYG